jgi:hypothetical protein
MSIEFPVFVLERDSGEIKRFNSREAMQRQFERIDVENHEYQAWDSVGAPLELRVEEPLWLAIDRSGQADRDALKAALLTYAKQRGCAVMDVEGLSLNELFGRISDAIKSTAARPGGRTSWWRP